MVNLVEEMELDVYRLEKPRQLEFILQQNAEERELHRGRTPAIYI